MVNACSEPPQIRQDTKVDACSGVACELGDTRDGVIEVQLGFNLVTPSVSSRFGRFEPAAAGWLALVADQTLQSSNCVRRTRTPAQGVESPSTVETTLLVEVTQVRLTGPCPQMIQRTCKVLFFISQCRGKENPIQSFLTHFVSSGPTKSVSSIHLGAWNGERNAVSTSAYTKRTSPLPRKRCINVGSEKSTCTNCSCMHAGRAK